jgi:Spy/CpxP family protein refolding chaperone
MNRCKSLLLLGAFSAVFALSFAVAASAQGNGAPRGNRQGGWQGGQAMGFMRMDVKDLAKAINLTNTQQQSIQAIQDKLNTDRKALMPQPGTQMDPATRSKMRDLMTQANKDIEAVLTKEQKTKLADLQKTAGLLGGRVPLSVIPSLKLTADQIKQMEQLRKDTFSQMQNTQPDPNNPQASRDARMQLFKDYQTKLQSILTTDQQDIIKKAMAAQRRNRPNRQAPPQQ